ncbi:hypothetical protein [Dactylosporangium sp. NPDC006015]|uniref:hypothetical protein n=1 Tax=Dactylosporangium sp. NPDC006015 TaxID=3154576 RepID=UPI0033A074F3
MPTHRSIVDAQMRTEIAQVLADLGESVLLHRVAGGAGSRAWYLLRSLADLDHALRAGKPSDSCTVFVRPELSYRGQASSALLELALAQLVGDAELVFGVLAADGPELRDDMVAWAPAPDAVADLVDWFAEHDGATIAFGPYPPFWSDDPAVNLQGYLPDPDGTIRVGAY